ncbi:MAG TPA: APC family permease [Thermomonas sp.]|nr:APC family permease [Thermomonas sp.]
MTDTRHHAAPAGKLLQVLGLAFGLAVLVGNTIGMGILRTPGEIAAQVPSIPLFMGVWVAGALYALLGTLTVSELVAMRPRSGGLYPLVHDGLGPYPGFVVGWSDWLSTCGSIAAVAIVLGEYASPLIPLLAGHEKLTASAVVLGFGLLQWRGIRIGDLAQQATSLVKALSLVALAVVALFFSQPAAPAAAAPVASALPIGLALVAAVIVAMQSAIYTYDGWTGPVYFSEELQDPARDAPRAMIAGVLLVMAIYLLLNAAFLSVIPIAEMAGDPFVAASAAARMFGPTGDTVLRIVMIMSLVASVNALVLMASRVPFAMSRDGLMPAVLQRVNAGGTPVPAMWTSVAVALALIATNTFNTMVALLAFMFVANYAVTFSTFFVLRRRRPDAPRPFRTPLYPLVPGLALLGSLAFIVAALASDTTHSLYALALVAVSWPVYRLFRYRHGGMA